MRELEQKAALRSLYEEGEAAGVVPAPEQGQGRKRRKSGKCRRIAATVKPR